VRRKLTIGWLLLVIAGLTACGDDGSEEAIGKDDFIAQANEICAAGNEELEQAAGEFFGNLELGKGQEPGPEEEAEFGSTIVIPNLERQVDDVEALGAPEGDEDEIDEIISQARAGLDQMREDPALAASERPVPDLDESTQRLVEYGVEACGA
jgi:hypothetical protein